MSDIIGADLGNELLNCALLDENQIKALQQHSRTFPILGTNRLFLEYQLKSDLVLQGYGHGYSYEEFEEVSSDTSHLCEERLLPLRNALARDPFLAERGYYMEDRLAGDPEWIEYDWDNGAFADDPAVFFMVPKRLRAFADAERLGKLCTHLVSLPGRPLGDPSGSKEPDLFAFLAKLRRSTPARMQRELAIYRLGLSDARAPGWMKLVISGVDADAIRNACGQHFGQVLDIFDPIVALYRRYGDKDQAPIIAGSIDTLHGDLHGADVECPYFHGIAAPDVRREAVAVFADQLSQRDILKPAVAEIIKANAYREFETADQEALLTLNHMKFGIAGATRGRIKLYFELMVRSRKQ